ncbi:MFS transporter [Mycolicibacterium sp. P1-18]|uniref:MFS transporter n=1 Tax=Mycolicibacterium sp. P1-18 TaxID=2024615 RepID=UPI0011F1AEAD|nr:MFS transporter [Mycolicibacterium sp. P1-18]KAA0097499.1 MFS transporter [Mycolicibacterium sp. P1-18]
MPSRQSLRALDAVNFFLADVRDGLGPYLAIYLLAVRGPEHGWNEATVGSVITIAGIVGLLSQTPAGILIDRVKNKRAIIVVAALAVTVSSVVLPFVSGFALIAISQSVASLAAAIFAPAIAAVTLGLMGPRMFAPRIGRNEAFNHAGNATAAGVAALLAWSLGPVVVFWLMGVLAVLSVVATSRIRGDEIDDQLARGLTPDDDDGASVGAWTTLVTNRPLMIFAIIAFTFHLANAAMLTSVSQLLTRVVGKDSATSLVALCILAAQLVMVPVAIVVGRKADSWGRKPIFLVAFAVLTLRGLLYTVSDNAAWLLAVQALDGIGAGIFGALFPIVIADLTRGSGRFNVAQGAVATVQGMGAALSATVAGFVIVSEGYTIAFWTLAAVAGIGLVLYAKLMPETKLATSAAV